MNATLSQFNSASTEADTEAGEPMSIYHYEVKLVGQPSRTFITYASNEP